MGTSRSGSALEFVEFILSAYIMWILASLQSICCSSSSCRAPSREGPEVGSGTKSDTLPQASSGLGPGCLGTLDSVSGPASNLPGMCISAKDNSTQTLLGLPQASSDGGRTYLGSLPRWGPTGGGRAAYELQGGKDPHDVRIKNKFNKLQGRPGP